MAYQISEEIISSYHEHLQREEYMDGTVQKYLRDIRAFAGWLREYATDGSDMAVTENDMVGDRQITNAGNVTVDKKSAAEWKSHLVSEGYAPVTINAMLSSLNSFFGFLGKEECKVKFLKIQRKIFRDQDKELSRAEYEQLLKAAGKRESKRLALLLETICATGIRVSEVKYITVEALRQKRADISLKGKIRTILLPGKLCRKLRDYAKKHQIKAGEIFITKSGKSMSRRQIWGEMKALCEKAGVSATKVFPHNLRHLFARTFYRVSRDIVKLADVLGHSSIETTRIYLISTGETHARQMERMRLIS